MSHESYPNSWARVVLMVSPTGEMHAIDGDREPGDPLADLPYVGLERIKKKHGALLMAIRDVLSCFEKNKEIITGERVEAWREAANHGLR